MFSLLPTNLVVIASQARRAAISSGAPPVVKAIFRALSRRASKELEVRDCARYWRAISLSLGSSVIMCCSEHSL